MSTSAWSVFIGAGSYPFPSVLEGFVGRWLCERIWERRDGSVPAWAMVDLTVGSTFVVHHLNHSNFLPILFTGFKTFPKRVKVNIVIF